MAQRLVQERGWRVNHAVLCQGMPKGSSGLVNFDTWISSLTCKVTRPSDPEEPRPKPAVLSMGQFCCLALGCLAVSGDPFTVTSGKALLAVGEQRPRTLPLCRTALPVKSHLPPNASRTETGKLWQASLHLRCPRMK